MQNNYQITLTEALEPDRAYQPIREQIWHYHGLAYTYRCPVCQSVVGSEVDGEWVGSRREECKNGHKIDWKE